MTATADPDADFDIRLMLVDSPLGGEPDRAGRAEAEQWLIERADAAFPHILARLETGEAGAGLIGLTPLFARAQSIAPLARIMSGMGTNAHAAAMALARHPQPEARAALLSALDDGPPQLGIIAADALGARADPGDCDALIAQLSNQDSGVRYHALQAAGRHCPLPAALLGALAADDEDLDVRALARGLLGE